MNILNSTSASSVQSPQRSKAAAKANDSATSEATDRLEKSSPNPLKGLAMPVALGAGGLAVGAGIVYKDQIVETVSNLAESMGPALEVAGVIAGGAAVGAIVGGVTGAGLGYLKGLGGSTAMAEEFWYGLGGGMAGLAVGAVVGGVSAGFGLSPLLAAPVVAVGAAGIWAHSKISENRAQSLSENPARS